MKTGYVALIGRPNVGKSTLLNTLIGQKVAIISDKPQTTRISILGIKTTDKGQIIFVDNPGIHKPLHKLNKRMMNFVHSSLETADLICLLIDATLPFGHGDEFVIETLKTIKRPLFLLINKVDIIRKDKILLIIDKYKDLLPFREIIPISAVKGTNLDVLEAKIYEMLPEAEKVYDEVEISNQTERFFLAEVIREKLLSHVEQELPFVTAVYIEKIEDRSKEEAGTDGAEDALNTGEAGDVEEKEARGEEAPLAESPKGGEFAGKMAADGGGAETRGKKTPILERPAEERAGKSHGKKKKGWDKTYYIAASIFVERDSHKGIIIGRQGRMIKTIGIEARREIQDYLGAKVYLDLSVKVREDWRDSADVLDLIEGQK